MRLRDWSPCLLTALLVVGCKSNPPAPGPVPDAGVVALPASPPKVERLEPALSYLQEVEPERCRWLRQPLPSGAPVTLFTFEASCTHCQLAWSPDGTQGLVHAWPSGEGSRERVWRVDFAAKKGQRMDVAALPGTTQVPGPDVPYIEQTGFDAQGRPVVLMADVFGDREPETGPGGERFFVSDGQRYPFTEEVGGTPGVASAWRLEGTQWKRFESRVSAYETDGAPGFRVLAASKGLITMSPIEEVDAPGQKASAAEAARWDAALPGLESSGSWWVLGTPGGKLSYRAVQNPEVGKDEPQSPLRWETADGLSALEGLDVPDGTPLRLQLQGEWLLVVVQREPRSAHVFDTRTRKRLVSQRGVELPLLWPLPSRP